MLYAEVILPLPLDTTFTYGVREEMERSVGVGHRVIVPFGKKKFYTGIVTSLSPRIPSNCKDDNGNPFEIKEIVMSLDNYPIVRHPQLKFWEWIADYYLCATGDVYKAAMPAGLKVESETFLESNPDRDEEMTDGLSEREAVIFQLLDHEGKLSVAEIEKKTGLKNVEQVASRMLENGVIIISEKLVERYRAKKETFVKLTDASPEGLRRGFEAVKNAPKQEALLLALIELSDARRGDSMRLKEVSRQALIERTGVTPAIVGAVAKKGVIEVYKKETGRFKFNGICHGTLPQLSEAQSAALDGIHRSWLDHDVTLLHGVTSSGKTEIYQHLINYVLNRGEQVLLLVPEIALTTQLTRRMQDVFGEKVVIYHSKFSDNERVDTWKRMLRTPGEPRVIIGARSAVFLPFGQLGAVIVDEEHEASYKQFDPAPRYNGRDAAMVLARMHGAKTLLGSATPSIETYYKALTGKFGLVELKQRYNDAPLPAIDVVDMLQARKSYNTRGPLATHTLKLAKEALDEGRQIILFQNRRGFAPLARCKMCAWTPKCTNCDVSLTYHRYINRLVCHYCGTEYALPTLCPQCKEPTVEILGYGTERVEDEVEKLFPSRRILRMDLDTTRNKDGYESIIDDFSAHKSDILVGTQMVTKGLDFGNVSVVVVMNADTLINFPDFRSGERAFNMLEQVSGRAGRRDDVEGRVVIQTSTPDHAVIRHVVDHDYPSHFETEIEDRRKHLYPPFTRIIYIYLKHRDVNRLVNIATSYTNRLHALLGNRVYGPDEPAVSRIQSLYIRKIMLKVETTASMSKLRQLLRQVYEEMHERPEMKGTIVYYDVDPW